MPIFTPTQYFWCLHGNAHIKEWLSVNETRINIYAAYINEANAVMDRKREGKPASHDDHMLRFLENYPMAFNDVIQELEWYVSTPGTARSTGLINVYAGEAQAPEIVAATRDILYKHVFDFDTRHEHWQQRRDQGLLNPDEKEPISKQQRSHERSQKNWAYRAIARAAAADNDDSAATNNDDPGQ